MKKTGTSTKKLFSIAMILAMIITGCGTGSNTGTGSDVITDSDIGSSTEETAVSQFTSTDKSVQIEVSGDWSQEDLASELDESISWTADGCISINSKNGTKSVLVMQFPKHIYSISDTENVKELAMQSCPMTDIEQIDNPSISGMTVDETDHCTVQLDEKTGEGRILYGETDYAYYFIMYVAPKISEKDSTLFNQICSSFQETAPEIENASTIIMTDTIQWFNNTCAILTVLNTWDYTLYGGQPVNESSALLSQNLLQNSWDVTDRDSADETLNWVLSEGHRVSFAQEMDYLADTGLVDVPPEEREQFLLDNFEITATQAQYYTDWFAQYEQNGDDTAAGWDYSRAMSLLGFYYLAGYYTEEESLDLSLTIAEDIQLTFDSWDSFMESYFIGYEYWAEEDSTDRREIYEELKAGPDSPFLLDWNMTFEKTW